MSLPVVVPVVVTDERTQALNTLYKVLNSIGTFILAINLFLIANPGYVSLAAAKWSWVGPVVMLIGRVAEAVQANNAKTNIALVHDNTETFQVQNVPNVPNVPKTKFEANP